MGVGADGVGRVAQAQSRMAAQLGIGGGTAPVLLEEHAKPILSRAKVLVGIHRTQHGVLGHPDVEIPHEGGEELVAAEALVGGE